jgi:hypothetical protein
MWDGYVEEIMRSEHLANGIDCGITCHFPAIEYLVYSGGDIGRMSSPAFPI